jgi:adenine-specific DNA-methyltransferase
LKQLFPEIWEEGKVDLKMLKKILGEKVETDRERYSFSWHGKSDAIKMALKQSTGTLRPKKADSKDWDKTNNLYIEGDNLKVLRVLQDSYRGKVKMIYIDPPYNTGKDFVYEDNFADNIQNYKEKVGDTMKANADSSGRKHTNWLNMMYPRLRLARNLLKDDGVIFISIDDNEQANLKKVCDEIFGEENFIDQFIVRSNPRGNQAKKFTASEHEYLVVYAKKLLSFQPIGFRKNINEYRLNDSRGSYRELGLRKRGAGSRKEDAPNQFFPIYYNPINCDISLMNKDGYIEIVPKLQNSSYGRWRWSKKSVQEKKDFLLIRPVKRNGIEEYDVFEKNYYSIDKISKIKSIFSEKQVNYENATEELKDIFNSIKVFDYSKPTYLVKKIIHSLSITNGIVLDFFAGSATTAHAVMQLNAEDGGNRKFIMVQWPEVTPEDSEARKAGYKNICEIGKERIRRAGEKIVKELKEKQEKKQEKLIEGDNKAVNSEDLDIGFKVFELDETNFTKWDPNTQDVEKSMMDQLNPIKADRADEDAVYEIMLKYGVDLTMPIEELKLAGKKVFSLAGNYLLLCLEKQIGLETVGEMAKLSPHRTVFFDDGFADDTVKANAEQTLKKAGVEEILVI